MGLVHGLLIHPADVQDRDGASLLFAGKGPDDFPRMKRLWVDGAYAGRCQRALEEQFGWDVEVVRRPRAGQPSQDGVAQPRGFQVLKWRWIVERTFGWLNRFRRLSKDYEQRPDSSAAFIYLALSAILLRRLVPA